MTTYAAFLRGIMPSNPNMRNEKLRGVFDAEGMTNVQSVISSGNIIFTSKSEDIEKLEGQLEKALTKKLGIHSGVFIRSQKDLAKLIAKDPFEGKSHSRETYLIVSFLKKKPWELFNVIDVTKEKTPDFMGKVDKEYSKEVTTRTWKTVERILKKMESVD